MDRIKAIMADLQAIPDREERTIQGFAVHRAGEFYQAIHYDDTPTGWWKFTALAYIIDQWVTIDARALEAATQPQ